MESKAGATGVEECKVWLPLFKDRKQYDNYRGIFLLSVPGIVLALILLERLQAIIDLYTVNGGLVQIQKGMWHC